MNHRATDELCQRTRHIFLPEISPAKNTHEFGDLCVSTYVNKRAFMMYFNTESWTAIYNSFKKRHITICLCHHHMFTISCVFFEEAISSLFKVFTCNTLRTCCLIMLASFLLYTENKTPYAFRFTKSFNLGRGFPFPGLHSPSDSSSTSLSPVLVGAVSWKYVTWMDTAWRCYSQKLSNYNDSPHLLVIKNAAGLALFLPWL